LPCPLLCCDAPPPTDIYTLSLHDALPISEDAHGGTPLGGQRAWPPARAMASAMCRQVAKRRQAPTTSRQAILETAMDLNDILRSDRKSTRLNSSHVKISYAVFCLKKKNNK